jgi:bacteriocin-type transport-associated protein
MAPTPESILFESLFFQWAQANGDTFSVESERTLIEEGVATPDLYLLLEGSGQVRTALEAEDGSSSSVDLAQIGPGQFVGEMSLLEDRLPVATVVALPGSRWIRVSYSLLLQAMLSDKALASSTYQVFAGKLALQLSSQNAFIHRWPGRDVEPLRKVLLVFGEWSELDVAWLAHQGERFDVDAGSTFIREGEVLDRLFVVLDGEADVLVDVEGSATAVGSSRRGEILGEMSFLGGDEQATATVQAREPMLLLAMPKQRIRAQLGDDLPFAERFYRSLAVLLSHRCRDQLMARGMAAEAAALEELDLTTLSNVSTAGRRFEWLCQEVAQR